METKKTRVVKAMRCGSVSYFENLRVCCQKCGVRYQEKLLDLIESGGLAPDGKTFFDWPTDYELKQIREGEIPTISEEKKW